MKARSYTSVTEDKGYPGVSGNAPLLHCVIVASRDLVFPFVAGFSYCPSTRLRVGAHRSVLFSAALTSQLTGVVDRTLRENEQSPKPGCAVENCHARGCPLVRARTNTRNTDCMTLSLIPLAAAQ